MKKSLVVLLILSFTISGCSSSALSKNDSGGDQQETKDNAGQDKSRRMPDFGQPKEDADLRGLVSSLTGNEVSILKMERPDMAKNRNGEEQAAGEQNGSVKSVSLGGGMGGGRMMIAGPGGKAPDEDARKQMLERIKEMSAGEEKIIVPVGIKMLKRDTANDPKSEPKMVEASLSDIKSDSMITIWLDKNVTDKKVASFVMIMN